MRSNTLLRSRPSQRGSNVASLLALVAVVACDEGPASVEIPADPPGGPKDDSVDEYAYVELECTGDAAVRASAIDDSLWADPFSAAVTTEAGRLTLSADLVRIQAAAGDDDGLWVELDEITLADSLFLLFARPAGVEAEFRPIAIPMSRTFRVGCSPADPSPVDAEPCVPLEEDPSRGVRSVFFDDEVVYLHWFSVVRGFDPETDAPRNNPTVAKIAEFFGLDPDAFAARTPVYKEEDIGEDGVMFWGLPRHWEERYESRLGGETPASLLNLAHFVPFKDIPAVDALGDAPLEWGVFGVPRSWGLGSFDPDWIGSFDYDLLVDCPGAGCETAEASSSAHNCGLPELWEP